MTESDTALGEIVRGEFEGDFIARQNANAITPETACEVRKHQTFVLQLHTEFTTGEFFDDGTLYFYAVFFTHSDLLVLFPVIVAEPARAAW